MSERRKLRWVIGAAFVALMIALTAGGHVLADKEALKYVGCARDVLRGDVHDLIGNYLKYGTYVLFLLPFVAMGLTQWAVLAQALLALAAAFAAARMVERMTEDRRSGDIAFVLILACIPLQQWVLALYTESFFASIAVLFLERVTRPGRADIAALLLAIVLVFARPIGLLFVGPALLWMLTDQLHFPFPRKLRNAGYAVVLLLAISLPGIARDQLAPIVEGHVICGFPELPDAMDHFHGSSILDAQISLFRHSPSYATGLFFRRVGSLFTLTRSYYSAAHNAFLAAHYVLFVLALYGWWRWRTQAMVGLLAVVLMLNTLLVGLTHDEWSGRFLVPLWPLIVFMAALGLWDLWTKRITRS
jgi:hypothetical protein